MLKRGFDFLFSLILIIILSPLFFIIAVIIVSGSKGNIFFRQSRVGFKGIDFNILKFRTMYEGANIKGLLTIGKKDVRITKEGYILRKYKLDELPQLINVFLGDMSFVGPRPEVRKYVEYYSSEQLKVLSVKPGITDYASIKYLNENMLLGKAIDPEKEYLEKIMPDKLALNLQYINQNNFITDLTIIFSTIRKIMFSDRDNRATD